MQQRRRKRRKTRGQSGRGETEGGYLGVAGACVTPHLMSPSLLVFASPLNVSFNADRWLYPPSAASLSRSALSGTCQRVLLRLTLRAPSPAAVARLMAC